jgi:hypothetical protein
LITNDDVSDTAAISTSKISGLASVATTGSASDLGTGTLADERLSANVSLKNIDNSFSVGQTITAAANTSALTASYSVTGANTTPLLDLSGTWNTTGVANGIRLNITSTASAFASKVIDLQVGGSSVFTVSKFGAGVFANSVSATGFTFTGTNSVSLVGTGTGLVWQGGNGALLLEAGQIIAQRNGTNAQTFRLYGNFTDSSNTRRLDITSTTGGIFTLTATGNGTGASGNLLKLTQPILLPASSVTLATNGDLAFEATSNTSLTIRYRGSDGTTRSASLTLA